MEMRMTSFSILVPAACASPGTMPREGRVSAMENVVLHLSPRCGRRWQGPAFTSVFGGQCANGGDNGGRKDTDQPLSEDLMHNKTSSALSCMAKMPRFLKGT